MSFFLTVNQTKAQFVELLYKGSITLEVVLLELNHHQCDDLRH